MLVRNANGEIIEVCRECHETADKHPFRMACPPNDVDNILDECYKVGQEVIAETRAVKNRGTCPCGITRGDCDYHAER